MLHVGSGTAVRPRPWLRWPRPAPFLLSAGHEDEGSFERGWGRQRKGFVTLEEGGKSCLSEKENQDGFNKQKENGGGGARLGPWGAARPLGGGRVLCGDALPFTMATGGVGAAAEMLGFHRKHVRGKGPNTAFSDAHQRKRYPSQNVCPAF